MGSLSDDCNMVSNYLQVVLLNKSSSDQTLTCEFNSRNSSPGAPDHINPTLKEQFVAGPICVIRSYVFITDIVHV